MSTKYQRVVPLQAAVTDSELRNKPHVRLTSSSETPASRLCFWDGWTAVWSQTCRTQPIHPCISALKPNELMTKKVGKSFSFSRRSVVDAEKSWDSALLTQRPFHRKTPSARTKPHKSRGATSPRHTDLLQPEERVRRHQGVTPDYGAQGKTTPNGQCSVSTWHTHTQYTTYI